jgi:Major Facilitator Superfamily
VRGHILDTVTTTTTTPSATPNSARSTRTTLRDLARIPGGGRYLLSAAVEALTSGLLRPFVVIYAITIGLDTTQAGVALTAGMLLGLAAIPLVGYWIDTGARRAPPVASLLVRAGGAATLALFPDAPGFVVGTALIGIATQVAPPATNALVAALTGDRHRTVALAAGRSIRNAGLGSGALLATALVAGGPGVLRWLAVATAIGSQLGAAALITVPLHRADPPGHLSDCPADAGGCPNLPRRAADGHRARCRLHAVGVLRRRARSRPTGDARPNTACLAGVVVGHLRRQYRLGDRSAGDRGGRPVGTVPSDRPRRLGTGPRRVVPRLLARRRLGRPARRDRRRRRRPAVHHGRDPLHRQQRAAGDRIGAHAAHWPCTRSLAAQLRPGPRRRPDHHYRATRHQCGGSVGATDRGDPAERRRDRPVRSCRASACTTSATRTRRLPSTAVWISRSSASGLATRT